TTLANPPSQSHRRFQRILYAQSTSLAFLPYLPSTWLISGHSFFCTLHSWARVTDAWASLARGPALQRQRVCMPYVRVKDWAIDRGLPGAFVGWMGVFLPSSFAPHMKISPLLPSPPCSPPLPRSPPSLPSRRRLHAAADAAFSPRRSRCNSGCGSSRSSRVGRRSPASLTACRDSGSGADLCAPTSPPPPLSLSRVPPSLQGAGEIGAEDKKQRVGCGGLELLGRWRRPSWFVMEAAPPASWLSSTEE
uniref:Uncharacterized protein n=2 Tax=Aegilops tauschii subsp. strangulata TaxID=200361 RepID=A0A453F9E7_AEGTS